MNIGKNTIHHIRSIMVTILVQLIRLYRVLFGPLLGSQCRFYPTCSRYSEEAFQQHGIIRGFWLTLFRIIRCQPFCKGGIDLVPKRVLKK